MLVTDFKALRCQAPRRIVGACDDHSRRPARAALQEPPAARRWPRWGRAPPYRPPLADGCFSDIRACPTPADRRPTCARNASASGARVRTDLADSGSLALDKGHPCMTDRPREREPVLQATLEATRAMTAAAKGVCRRLKASRVLLFRARASGCTVGYGFGMAAAGFASGSCMPALSGKPLSGAPFAGHTPGRLPIRLARRFACARWGCTVAYGRSVLICAPNSALMAVSSPAAGRRRHCNRVVDPGGMFA